MNAILPPGNEANTWLGRHCGFRTRDALAFHGDVRIRTGQDKIFALHRGPDLRELGWECHYRTEDDPLGVRYRKGLPKGIVGTPPLGATRLIVTEGALSAIAAAALLPGEARTCVAGIGGVWTAEAAACVVGLLFRTRAEVVEVAFSQHHRAGQEMHKQAVHYLSTGGIDAVPLDAPPGGWLAALREARQGGRAGA